MLKCFFYDFVELAIQIRGSRMVVLGMPFCKPGAVQIALRYESSRVALYVGISYSFLRLMRYCYEKGMEGPVC